VDAPSITPAPTTTEAIAIVAAMEALWPQAVMIGDETLDARSSWRFSGRWWNVPLPVRRGRPWR